jgi:hypothetical protein
MSSSRMVKYGPLLTEAMREIARANARRRSVS